jgi:hypothetical protein
MIMVMMVMTTNDQGLTWRGEEAKSYGAQDKGIEMICFW